MVDQLLQDIRHSIRSLAHTPGFTLAAVLTLALGIGANTTIFSVLDAVMFKPLPLPAAGELATLYEKGPEGNADTDGGTGRFLRFSYARFQALQNALGDDGSLAAMTRTARFIMRRPGSPQTDAVQVQLVSGRYFATLGIQVERGRALSDADVRPDRIAQVAVVSDTFWRRKLAAAADIIGQGMTVNGVPITIVGVAPPGFIGTWTDTPADLWLPLTLQQALKYQFNSSTYAENVDRTLPWVAEERTAWLNLVARIRPAALAQARPRLEVVNRAGLPVLLGGVRGERARQEMLAHTLVIEPFARGFSFARTRFGDTLWVLSAIVGTVLLVTCVNIVNLLLARAAAKSRELGVRIALGATRWRVVRQALVESVLLAAMGGAGGFMVSRWASAALSAAILSTTPDLLPPAFAIDMRVLLFTATVSLAAAVVCGMLPALRGGGLAAGAIAASHQRMSAQGAVRGMRPLVAAQFALSFLLVCGAGLLGRTVVNFNQMNPGFETAHLLSVSFDAAATGYALDETPALHERLLRAARALPGASDAVISMCGLIADCSSSGGVRFEGQPYIKGEEVSVGQNWVGPRYFATVGIPLVSGREFSDRDSSTSPRVAIINALTAHRFFPNADPVGKHLGTNLEVEIIGVAGDARVRNLRDAPSPLIYFPLTQSARVQPYARNLDVRLAANTPQATEALRNALLRLEPGLVIDAITPMSRRLERNVARERLVAAMALAFAALSLFLASLGLYGVLSYTVARRTKEIGVRTALGARASTLSVMIVGDALRTIAIGLVAGIGMAFWAGRLLQTLLFGVDPRDVFSYATASAALVVVALAACYMPARRAARVDPVVALRAE